MTSLRTPGNWIAKGTELRDEAGFFIADFNCSRDKVDVENCRLAALAPEILDALRAVYESVHVHTFSSKLLHQVEIAILKAEGN